METVGDASHRRRRHRTAHAEHWSRTVTSNITMESHERRIESDEAKERRELDAEGLFRAPEPQAVSVNKYLRLLKSHWKIVLYGQFVSFMVACSGAIQSNLALHCQFASPAFSVGLYYACLAGFLIPLCVRARHRHQPISSIDGDVVAAMESSQQQLQPVASAVPPVAPTMSPPYHLFLGVIPLQPQSTATIYFGMACLDFYANYCTVMAFQFTTLTSVALLTALAIPSSMVLSFLTLNRHYSSLHYLGVLLCSVGILFNVWQDYEADQASGDKDYPNKLWGDLLALAGGLLYGTNDVFGEMAVRKLGGPVEYLGMLGFFASLIAFFHAVTFEWDIWTSFIVDQSSCSGGTTIGLMTAFVISNAAGYVAGAHFLQMSEATFFNLSLQTGSLWSILFSVVSQHKVPHIQFYAALIVTVSGVCVYEMAPSPVLEDREAEDAVVSAPTTNDSTSIIAEDGGGGCLVNSMATLNVDGSRTYTTVP